MIIHIAMKHPPMPYGSGHTAAGFAEKVFTDKSDAEKFVKEKNSKATFYLWSIQSKKITGHKK